jgi:predicted DNA-binding transcriptional regulator AlpA
VVTEANALANLAKDPSMRDKHLTPEDLAEREGVPLETVYGWNKTGKGPRYMKIGRHCRYRLADVIAWEKTRIVERTGVA